MPARHRPFATAEHVRRQLGPGPVLVTEVISSGVSRGQLRAAIAAGTIRQVRYGVVAAAATTPPHAARDGIPEERLRDAAAATTRSRDEDLRRARRDAAAHSGDEHLRRGRRDAAAAVLLRRSPDTLISHCSAALLHRQPTPRPGRDHPRTSW